MLLHGEISKTSSKIKEFLLFPNFVVKLKVFKLTYHCLILFFHVVFPVYNICRKFQLASMNILKAIACRKLQNSLLDLKISSFLKFSILLFGKIDFFPFKKPFSFFNHREI